MAAGMSAALRNARLDAITAFAGSGAKLQLYNGTRPATGGAVTTKLAEFTMGGALGGAASGGVLTITPPADVVGLAAGTATWARLLKSDGTTHVMDLSVGTSAADIILNTTTVSVGVDVSIDSGSLTEGNP